MRYWFIVILALLLSGNCFSKSLPVEDLARRVTEGTSKNRILFRLLSGESGVSDAAKRLGAATLSGVDAHGTAVARPKDFFEISAEKGKVLIAGNSNLSLSAGLNWYLKYVAHIHLSWNNLSQPLPEVLPLPEAPIRKETAMLNRYYLNYCTFSYSMAFWDWKRWEKEIDWMALHGINMPLSITGVETVWYNLLKRVGYTTEEINEFISGPAFMAWWQMNNLEGWGGPNPDSWYRQQEVLQKKIVSRMRELGIEPVFPGYSGMVPRNIGEKLGYPIADPGRWCGFPRPAFLSPEDERFASFAAMYYEELEKLYGTSRYYSMDPFHEGGNTQGVNLAQAGESILAAMKKANPQAVWVIQAWQANPREEMIAALDPGDLMVLDLYSEKRPQWGDPRSEWCRANGFGKHDWLYCMLLNFGGNVGLHGRMDQLINGYYDACGHPNGRTLRGVGTTPEGIENNPVMFELLYELPWRAERFDADDWLQGYLQARYGKEIAPEVAEAWRALLHTVYNAPVNLPGEGTIESLLCARPGFHLDRTSTWGHARLFYAPDSTAKAARLMQSVAARYRGVNNFEYDRVDILRQANADRGNALLKKLSDSFDRQDKEQFRKLSAGFLNLILEQDSLLSTRKEFTVGHWLEAARASGKTPEEQKCYEWNASALITVWGDRVASNDGGLHDYSHREWSGLLKDLYYRRWKAFFVQKQLFLDGMPSQGIDFYEMEKEWAERFGK